MMQPSTATTANAMTACQICFCGFSGSELSLKPASSVVILAKSGFCKCDEILNLLDEL